MSINTEVVRPHHLGVLSTWQCTVRWAKAWKGLSWQAGLVALRLGAAPTGHTRLASIRCGRAGKVRSGRECSASEWQGMLGQARQVPIGPLGRGLVLDGYDRAALSASGAVSRDSLQLG